MASVDTDPPHAAQRTAPEGSGYRIQTPASLGALLADIPLVAGRLGGDAADWQVHEISDGNMNSVFLVTGQVCSVVVKQSLPFIRVIGESWPFPLERIEFEHEALQIYANIIPGAAPSVLLYDHDRALVVMEHLAPHVVLRKGLIGGRIFPHLADQLGGILARTYFFTSDFFLGTHEKRAMMRRFDGNEEMCSTTEDVIFTGPYTEAPLNRWTRPDLDETVADLRADTALKLAATELKLRLRSSTEALIHGDLHTGSIMASDDDTRLIDPEWARYGPIGFDLGAIFGNLLLAYFSQAGHATPNDDRSNYGDWILTTMAGIWKAFDAELRRLIESRGGELFPPELFGQRDLVTPMVNGRLQVVFADAIGFAGAKMIRRVVGISHVEDMETIPDPSVRARCEAKALFLARAMVIRRHAFRDMTMLTANARSARGVDMGRGI